MSIYSGDGEDDIDCAIWRMADAGLECVVQGGPIRDICVYEVYSTKYYYE
jgi:hypothetical protein